MFQVLSITGFPGQLIVKKERIDVNRLIKDKQTHSLCHYLPFFSLSLPLSSFLLSLTIFLSSLCLSLSFFLLSLCIFLSFPFLSGLSSLVSQPSPLVAATVATAATATSCTSLAKWSHNDNNKRRRCGQFIKCLFIRSCSLPGARQHFWITPFIYFTFHALLPLLDQNNDKSCFVHLIHSLIFLYCIVLLVVNIYIVNGHT